MKTDWKLLGIQLIGVWVIPSALTIYGYSQWEYYFPTARSFVTAVLVAMFILILLTILMMVIFFNEAKKHTNEAFSQTVIFGISLIPMILMWNWIIALLCPQVLYWATNKYSWRKKVEMIIKRYNSADEINKKELPEDAKVKKDDEGWYAYTYVKEKS